jgi:hypothetical protein
MTNYILTLDFIKQECLEVAGQWNGDASGSEEVRADIAKEILMKVNEIELLLPQILNV